jgi:hypothetical protein
MNLKGAELILRFGDAVSIAPKTGVVWRPICAAQILSATPDESPCSGQHAAATGCGEALAARRLSGSILALAM